jgi:hypothetical protein
MQRFGVTATLLGGLTLACGSDPVNARSTGSPPTMSTAAPVTCEETDFGDPSLPTVSVGEVSVTLHDSDDAPIVGQPVMVCGAYVCGSIAHTDDTGAAAATVGGPTIKPALKFGDALTYPELAILLDDPAKGATFPVLTLPAFPSDGAPLTPGTSATSNGVTLTLDTNASVLLDTTTYMTPDQQAFRAVELAPDRIPAGLDAGAGLEQVFALAPVGAEPCPAAALTLPNSAGWDPGTAVEFLIEGLQVVDQPYAPYGDWQSIGTGAVDDSGATLVLTSGTLPIISNVGVRRL